MNLCMTTRFSEADKGRPVQRHGPRFHRLPPVEP